MYWNPGEIPPLDFKMVEPFKRRLLLREERQI